jgi:hypothetical protein
MLFLAHRLVSQQITRDALRFLFVEHFARWQTNIHGAMLPIMRRQEKPPRRPFKRKRESYEMISVESR